MPHDVYTSRGSGRVLFADDDESVFAPTAKALVDLGFHVDCVCTASEAAYALTRLTYDALLLDINMPGNERLELAEELFDVKNPVPVVVLTGYPSLDTVVQALRVGVVDYIVKPPRIPELAARLTRAIRRRRALAAMGSADEQMGQLLAWMKSVETSLVDQLAAPPPTPDLEHILGRLPKDAVRTLTPRESEVLVELSRGFQAREIGQRLGLSTNTVRGHIRSLFSKLQVNSQIGLLAKFLDRDTL